MKEVGFARSAASKGIELVLICCVNDENMWRITGIFVYEDYDLSKENLAELSDGDCIEQVDVISIIQLFSIQVVGWKYLLLV
jgi:hypothetical protein